jgi:hypothetical protein
MIAQVSRGKSMPGLMDYLFGPGSQNEHVDQHLVAGYEDCEHSAPPELWQSEPGMVRRVRAQARALGWELEFPNRRYRAEVSAGHVWHCSLSLRPDEGPLTDEQWPQAARMLVETLGFSGEDGKAPCRWVAVRHGTSAGGNDHIHVAVSVVREDGTRAQVWRDYRKASQACALIEERFGLDHLAGRATGRSLPEASRADIKISARLGDAEPVRIRLERTIRAIVAASSGEADFVARARARGLLLRPRFAPGDQEVTGYSVAEENGRQVTGGDGRPGPLWFGGSSLAPDLSLPRLRRRWQPEASADLAALGAWTAASQREPVTLAPAPAPAATRITGDEVSAADVAGLLAAAATGLEPGQPGPLSKAARLMARAAQAPADQNQAPRVLRELYAIAFHLIADPETRSKIALIKATGGTGAAIGEHAVRLARERAVARAVRARYGTQPGTGELLRDIAGEYLAVAAIAHRMGGTASSVRWLARLTAVLAVAAVTPESRPEARRAGELTARYATATTRLAPRPQPARPANETAAGMPAQGRGPARQPAGSRRQPGATPYDGKLRDLLGEDRWRQYAADPRRHDISRLIRRAHSAGQDVGELLTTLVTTRPLEDDPRSPARSVAGVLGYRLGRALSAGPPRNSQATASRLSNNLSEFLARSTAPAGSAPPGLRRTDPAERTPWQRQNQQKRDRQESRQGRDA